MSNGYTGRSSYRTKKQIEAPKQKDSGVFQQAATLGMTAMPFWMKMQDRMMKNSEILEDVDLTWMKDVDGTATPANIFQHKKKKINVGRWSKGLEVDPSYMEFKKAEWLKANPGEEWNRLNEVEELDRLREIMNDKEFADRDITNVLDIKSPEARAKAIGPHPEIDHNQIYQDSVEAEWAAGEHDIPDDFLDEFDDTGTVEELMQFESDPDLGEPWTEEQYKHWKNRQKQIRIEEEWGQQLWDEEGNRIPSSYPETTPSREYVEQTLGGIYEDPSDPTKGLKRLETTEIFEPEFTDDDAYFQLQENEWFELGNGDIDAGKRIWESKHGYGKAAFESHMNEKVQTLVNDMNLPQHKDYVYTTEFNPAGGQPWNTDYTRDATSIDMNPGYTEFPTVQDGVFREGTGGERVTYDGPWSPDNVIHIPEITQEQSQIVQAGELSKAKMKYQDMKRSTTGNKSWTFDKDATILDKKVALNGDIEVVRKYVGPKPDFELDYSVGKGDTIGTGLVFDPKDTSSILDPRTNEYVNVGNFKKAPTTYPTKLGEGLPSYKHDVKGFSSGETYEKTFDSPSWKMPEEELGFFKGIGKGSVKKAWGSSTPGKVVKAVTHIGRGGVKAAWQGSTGQAVTQAIGNLGKGGLKNLAAHTFGQTAATTATTAATTAATTTAAAAGGAASGAAAAGGAAANAGLFASMGPAGWTMLALSLVGGKLFKPHTLLGKIFSDKRLKKNIRRIGKSPSGINIYEFNYKDIEGTYRGVVSQDTPSDAVERDFNGYDMVDYNKIDVNFEKIK